MSVEIFLMLTVCVAMNGIKAWVNLESQANNVDKVILSCYGALRRRESTLREVFSYEMKEGVHMKNQEFKARKAAIRAFFVHYTDERLAMLLAHAQEGKLRHESCCCFAMAHTVTHGLIEGYCDDPGTCGPYDSYQFEASWNFNRLAKSSDDDADAKRRRILIPMIRAELRRRDRAKQTCELVCTETTV
jgi:hypothetical protein